MSLPSSIEPAREPSKPVRTPLRPVREPLSDAPVVTVAAAVLALVLLPLAQRLSAGVDVLHGLEPFMELVAVLLGLLVVSVSLRTFERQEQARANVLVAGFGVAAACNLLHGMLLHFDAAHPPLLAGSADISLWLSSWARVAEVTTLWFTAMRLSAPGLGRTWLAVACAITLALVGLSLGPLPGWFAQVAGSALHQPLALALALALIVAATVLQRSARRNDQPRERILAWATTAFACGEITVGALGAHGSVASPLAHGLRVIAYALLYQAVFDAGIRRPFARIQEAESRLRESESRLARVVSAMPDMVFLKDADGVYLSVNPVFERFIGRPEHQIVGRNDFDLTTPAQARQFRQNDQRAMQTRQPLVYEETLTFAEDGYQGRFETIKTPIRDLHGRVTGVLGVCRDITERKRAAQEIERLAFYDALTGLPNRRLLLDRLQRSIATCQRTHKLGALLFIDLDNFKDLNDTLGHDMGDQLLAQVATRLVASVRAADTVARFGGDEFVVMLEALAPDLRSATAQAEMVADKLLASLNQPFALDGGQHYSTLSIGVTLFGEQRLSVDELLKRADLALYQAKAAGRNTQRFFDPDMQAAVNARSNLEADLRQGLARAELLVYYQPVVDHRARLMGAEALVRWRHPQRGMIGPADFIPLAEQTGLILPLGQYVLQTACAQLQRWSRHPDTAGLSISVNVSARQFRQPGFVAQVLHQLKSHGADPRRLKLELTESLLLGDIEDTIARMAQLKSEGVGFALDDFGTGYSSLSYLKRLPLDQIKIDQSFVREVLADPNDAAIVRTILALAKSLDLQVVAEGVETTGQLSFLQLHGCEGFQGYLFGRPVPMEVFACAHRPGKMPQPQAGP
ncbi:putative bifunctional diguanylate cyclase/phosphodiesterase [Verminephrobacter eiseniae]|uniref:putative bifunctional diguanylate cyclase/phosphodiesterase n=1 Tax=Verminephrobacter eiseniae TaxID=364317 RepID=UPI0022374904|nr:EAL domain-containing protein [Verminephrobacter eiseniae]MCW5294262.1 EAL domain-containing protein [Verminephrobacter eiseniae]